MPQSKGDDSRCAGLLLETECLREHVTRAIIEWLDLPEGSRGLDAGCGIGSCTLALADTVGPRGHVTGLDTDRDLLRIAGERMREKGYGDRTDFRKGDINKPPFDPQTFDWVWSADCAGPGTGDPFAQVRGLAELARPGGRLNVLAWSSQNLLPGYPLLEARLNATPTGIAPFKRNMDPKTHLFQAGRWFADAGLEDVRAKTFAGDIQSPLDEGYRKALCLLFDMRWGGAQGEVDEETWSLFKRLTDPASAEFILDRPGYYAFFTYTVFSGSKTR